MNLIHVIEAATQSKFIAKQLYWNHTLTWVFSCKLAAYFQNTFSQEHLWTPASDVIPLKSWFLPGTYLGSIQRSMMELFFENN